MVWAVSIGRFFNSASSFVMLFLTLYLTGPRGLGIATAGILAGSSGIGWLAGNFTGGGWGTGSAPCSPSGRTTRCSSSTA